MFRMYTFHFLNHHIECTFRLRCKYLFMSPQVVCITCQNVSVVPMVHWAKFHQYMEGGACKDVLSCHSVKMHHAKNTTCTCSQSLSLKKREGTVGMTTEAIAVQCGQKLQMCQGGFVIILLLYIGQAYTCIAEMLFTQPALRRCSGHLDY